MNSKSLWLEAKGNEWESGLWLGGGAGGRWGVVTTAIRQIWMTHHSSIYRVLQESRDKPQRLTTESAEVELKQLSLTDPAQSTSTGTSWSDVAIQQDVHTEDADGAAGLPVSCTECPGRAAVLKQALLTAGNRARRG